MKKCLVYFFVSVFSITSLTGCFKASKQEIVESDYYVKLEQQNEKLSKQLKQSENREKSLEKKIKTIHQSTGDQSLADYKKAVKAGTISRVDFMRASDGQAGFSVTNIAVCNYAKDIVKNSFRIIGMTVGDIEKEYKNPYSYALIDEDNTAYEFKVYGTSYIVFDKIPENVYCFNNASLLGEALIDAPVMKKYQAFTERVADAQIIVTDKKIMYNTTAIKLSKLLIKLPEHVLEGKTFDTKNWTDYRCYTSGSLTKILLSETDNVVCVEDKKGTQTFYQTDKKTMKKINNLLNQ